MDKSPGISATVKRSLVAHTPSAATQAKPSPPCSAPSASHLSTCTHTHHLAKDTMRELLNQQGRRPPTDLLELARRCGVAP